MKRDKVNKALIVAFGAALLAAAAGCSSSQKPAALGTTGAGATSTASSSATSGSTTDATSSSAASSSSSSAAASSSAPAAPTTVATSSGGWSFKATVPGDTDSAAAMAAFQKYREEFFQMEIKADYSKDISSVADGNVLTLSNNTVLQFKQNNLIMVGTQTDTVTATKLDMSAKPLPTMTITQCKDATKLHLVFASGPNKGKSAAKDLTHPSPAIYTVHKSADGKWRVSDVQAESDKTC